MKIQVITAAALFAVVATTTVQAGDGATVAKEFGCGIIAADSGLSAYLGTNESHSVVTPSGNTSLICHFDVPEALQDEVGKGTIRNEGFPCSVPGGLTYDTKAVTNKNKVLLVCQI